MSNFEPKRVSLTVALARLIESVPLKKTLIPSSALRILAFSIAEQRMDAWYRKPVELGDCLAPLLGGGSNPLVADGAIKMDPRFWQDVANSHEESGLVDPQAGTVQIGIDDRGESIWASCELDPAEIDKLIHTFSEIAAQKAVKMDDAKVADELEQQWANNTLPTEKEAALFFRSERAQLGASRRQIRLAIDTLANKRGQIRKRGLRPRQINAPNSTD